MTEVHDYECGGLLKPSAVTVEILPGERLLMKDGVTLEWTGSGWETINVPDWRILARRKYDVR